MLGVARVLFDRQLCNRERDRASQWTRATPSVPSQQHHPPPPLQRRISALVRQSSSEWWCSTIQFIRWV